MKQTQLAATLGILIVLFVAPADPAAAIQRGGIIGGGILDSCTGVASIDHRVKVTFPADGLDYGTADDNEKGDKGVFALIEGPLVTGAWEYAMSGETAGQCAGALTAEVCSNLVEEARELLRPHCPAE